METKGKRKYAIMLLVIMMLQVILPTVSVVKENIFTNFSSAAVLAEYTIGTGVKAKVKASGNSYIIDVCGSSEYGKGEIGQSLMAAISGTPYENVKKLTFDENITYICGGFASGLPIETVEGKNSIKRIGKEAFNGCKNLTTVVGFDGIVTIGEKAFMDCTSLRNYNDGSLKGCRYLGERAFENTAITFLKKAEDGCEFGKHCFRYCDDLRVLDVRNVKYFTEGAKKGPITLNDIRGRIGLAEGSKTYLLIRYNGVVDRRDDWKRNILILNKTEYIDQSNGYRIEAPVLLVNNMEYIAKPLEGQLVDDGWYKMDPYDDFFDGCYRGDYRRNMDVLLCGVEGC